jgi:hypothetical protein
MQVKKLNWPLWAGLLLSLAAFISYPFVFVWTPATRDFPWANLILFGIAAVLLFVGLRRAFAKDLARPTRSRIKGVLVAGFSVLVFGMFMMMAFVAARWMPAATGAPQVGQKAPEFTLPDINNQPVALSELLTSPINGQQPKGVLLIFYRGYW